MTAASARRSSGMRWVPATVPLPTGLACSATAVASRPARSARRGSKARKSRTARRNVSTYSACVCSRRCRSASRFWAWRGEARSEARSPRIDSMTPYGAHTPREKRPPGSSRRTTARGAHTSREKSLRPFRTCTAQCGPAALTRRARDADPGEQGSKHGVPGRDAEDDLTARDADPGEQGSKPDRARANLVVRDGKARHTDDPGGQGFQITREVVVCPDCARKCGAR